MRKLIYSLAFGLALSLPAAAQTITLKASHSANADEPYHAGLTYFAEKVKERTGGRVVVQIFPSNQLGNEKEMLEGLLLGTVDFAVTANGVLTNFVPAVGIFDLPFLFRDRAHMYKSMDGVVGQQLREQMAKRGFHLLGFYEAGIRHLLTKKPVEKMADIQNLKIRTMQVASHIAAFKSFGANPTPLPYDELYGALQAGVVDGAEAANSNYYSKKFFEVAPYYAQLAWTALVAELLVSEKKLRSLPPDIQKIIIEVGQESAVVERKAYADTDERIMAQLLKHGVKVTNPDPVPFREASKKVYETFVKTDEQKAQLQAILGTQ